MGSNPIRRFFLPAADSTHPPRPLPTIESHCPCEAAPVRWNTISGGFGSSSTGMRALTTSARAERSRLAPGFSLCPARARSLLCVCSAVRGVLRASTCSIVVAAADLPRASDAASRSVAACQSTAIGGAAGAADATPPRSPPSLPGLGVGRSAGRAASGIALAPASTTRSDAALLSLACRSRPHLYPVAATTCWSGSADGRRRGAPTTKQSS